MEMLSFGRQRSGAVTPYQNECKSPRDSLPIVTNSLTSMFFDNKHLTINKKPMETGSFRNISQNKIPSHFSC